MTAPNLVDWTPPTTQAIDEVPMAYAASLPGVSEDLLEVDQMSSTDHVAIGCGAMTLETTTTASFEQISSRGIAHA